MPVTLNWISLLLAVIISQSLFAAGLLFFSANNRFSNRILSVLIVCIALWLVDDFLRISGVYDIKPNLYFLPIFYSLGFGPLIWFYVRSLVNVNFKFKTTDVLNFVPVIIQSVLYWVLTFSSYHTKYWYWMTIHRKYTYRIEFDGTWISLMIYLVLSFRLIRHYRLWVVNNFSEVSRIRLNWLRTILLALIVLCVQWFIEIILRDGFNIYFKYDFSVDVLGILLLILGVAGLRQSNLGEIAYEQTVAEKTAAAFEADDAILQKIIYEMDKNRYFLNPTLSLAEFSAALNLNSWVVSRHINSGLDKSFNDFVNGYRVEEVKRRLRVGDLKKFTIMSIAFDSGFNSKTTFNRIFKATTGQSPSAYISTIS